MQQLIERTDFPALLASTSTRGYTLVGPTVRDETIAYDVIGSVDDLPSGWGDEQQGGRYRLRRRSDAALFGYTAGPQSWKRFLLPPERRLWRAHKSDEGVRLSAGSDEPTPRYALLGVRACELQALGLLDQALTRSDAADPHYQQARTNALLIAVNCGQAANTCFCASMNSGPGVREGFDLALTEVIEADRHYFVVTEGSPRGSELLEDTPHRPASAAEVTAAEVTLERAISQMGRSLDTQDLPAALKANQDHPRWDDVGRRCLACANCTMVCPTCFCFDIEDVTDLTGTVADRLQKWDSCFTREFTYIHGGSVRSSVRSRYRQWLTHKLAYWHDQFGSSGCVGCGRCITWCPVGIDITAEAAAIARSAAESSTRARKPPPEAGAAKTRQANGNQEP